MERRHTRTTLDLDDDVLSVLRALARQERRAFGAYGYCSRRLATARQVTDAHLLTLAARRDGQLVTFDRGVVDLAGDPGLVRLRR